MSTRVRMNPRLAALIWLAVWMFPPVAFADADPWAMAAYYGSGALLVGGAGFMCLVAPREDGDD